MSILNLVLLHVYSKSISQSVLALKLAPNHIKRVVKRSRKSLIPTHNYPKMAVSGNLPQNCKSLWIKASAK